MGTYQNWSVGPAPLRQDGGGVADPLETRPGTVPNLIAVGQRVRAYASRSAGKLGPSRPANQSLKVIGNDRNRSGILLTFHSNHGYMVLCPR